MTGSLKSSQEVSNRIQMIVKTIGLDLAKDEDGKECLIHTYSNNFLHNSIYISQCLTLSCGGIPLLLFQFLTVGFTLMTIWRN